MSPSRGTSRPKHFAAHEGVDLARSHFVDTTPETKEIKGIIEGARGRALNEHELLEIVRLTESADDARRALRIISDRRSSESNSN